MKFSAKNILQIVLLVILLVAGATVFLWQDNTGGILAGLFGEETPAPTPTPVPKLAPKPKAPEIPAEPAKGQIQNQAFVVESAEIEGGVLTLRQGGTDVKLFLRTNPWEAPVGRSFQFLQTSASGSPLVRIRWREAGQEAPRQRDFANNYTLRLEFGQEQERRVPGKIYLSLPDEDKSQLAGTFTADVRGFRLVNGKPDLASDSVDTLQYLALREILKDDPDKSLQDVSFRQARYNNVGPVPTGYLEFAYRPGEAALALQKFQFIKDGNAWRIAGTLRPDQLDEAHPLKVPSAKDNPERVFPYQAAQRIEAEMRKRNPGRLLSASEFATRHSDKHKIGVSEVSYRVDDEQPIQTAFLFRRSGKGWTLTRELNKKERVNLATGKIETQR